MSIIVHGLNIVIIFCSWSSSGRVHLTEQPSSVNRLEKWWGWSVFRDMERHKLRWFGCCFNVWNLSYNCKYSFLQLYVILLIAFSHASYCFCCNRELSALGLSGTLGYLLSNLLSLRKMWGNTSVFFPRYGLSFY